MVYYPGLFASASEAAPSGPGAMPAFSSVGTVTDAANAVTTNAVTRPAALAVGDLMVMPCLVRTADATTITISMHASMSSDGWAQMSGSPFAFGAANHEAAVFWKFAEASDVSGVGAAIPGGVTTTHNGLTTSDGFGAAIYRFTAADGFAANPFESISSSAASGTGAVAMNTVTPTAINRLGVTFILLVNDSQAMAAATGETGGNWVEANDYDGVQELTLQLQTADLSAGAAISGGTATHAGGTVWVVISFALVPADA